MFVPIGQVEFSVAMWWQLVGSFIQSRSVRFVFIHSISARRSTLVSFKYDDFILSFTFS
jgi:hypothetical protein